MIKKLNEIANIQFGPYEKGCNKGSVKYLLASHFDETYKLSKFSESYIEKNERNEKSLLQPNDVILAGKGHRKFAWAYDIDLGATIPSSLFYLIRVNSDILLGEYLAYYLNSEKIQYKLKLISAGGTIPSISKSELVNIKINIPPIKEQKKIIEFARLLDKNIELTNSILEKKKALKKEIINNMIYSKLK